MLLIVYEHDFSRLLRRRCRAANMSFILNSLIQAALLCGNVLHEERFLSRSEWEGKVVGRRNKSRCSRQALGWPVGHQSRDALVG
ncbi:hypothetical protein NDU88_002778 [Pleurodeles waltl]|uniref:Uncharacterized protein n=1 Tax=Pleurodeles waltl TaxID=8319 RepID=A0AAV7RES3_PLEWA|nr:hypothetical protein NDU88_002778 [Pleurodeles waltl]